MAKLNIGCGNNIRGGWINIDLYNENAEVKADATTLPFPDNFAEEIMAEHVLEHISYHKTMPTLYEWHRVLAPNGKAMLMVPDMEFLSAELIKSDNYFSDIIRAMYGSHENAGQIHYTGFTFKTLKQCLEIAGFINIKKMPSDHVHHLWVRADKKKETK